MIRFVLMTVAIAVCVWLNVRLLSFCSPRALLAGDMAVFVPVGALLTLYVLCDSDTAMLRGRLTTSAFRLVWGLCVVSLVVAAMRVVASQCSDPALEFWTIACPVVGLALYNFGNTLWGAAHVHGPAQWPLPRPKTSWRGYIRQRAVHDFVYPAGGLLFTVVSLNLAWPMFAICRPFALFAILTMLLAVECIRQGVKDAKFIRAEGQSFLAVLRQSGGFRVGTTLLTVWFLTLVLATIVI